VKKKTIIAKASKDGDAFIAVASTESIDRHGEAVEASGWDLGNFKANPVILWQHNHDEPAIGKAEHVWVEKAADKSKLMIKLKFHEITERARAVKELFEQGILNSFSVGFIPQEAEGNTFTKQELLEVSAVNVPANPEARRLAYKSLKEKGFKNKTIEEFVDVDYIKLEQRVSLLETKTQTLVKAIEVVNPNKGRVKDVRDTKIALTKAIARASDKILEGKGVNSTDLAKVIKRANEKLNKEIKES